MGPRTNAAAVAVAAVLVGALSACSSDERPGNPKATKEPDKGQPAKTEPTKATPPNPVFVDPGAYDFSKNERLLHRITETPHGYFRFVNVPFAEAVCRRFADSIEGMPAVNLHGDAHVEQYAVTGDGRGLTDFDDSSTGPCVIDLVRFGVSLDLAARQRGWEAHRRALLETFLDAYVETLKDPAAEPEKPALVDRTRRAFPPNRTSFLARVEAIMEEPDVDTTDIEEPYARYASLMHSEHEALPDFFFHRKRLGRIHVGVGSALDEKYLMRVEGPSRGPNDDVVLEIKEVRDLEGIGCLDVSRRADPFRILVGQSRLSYRPYGYVGYIRWRGKTFWIHAWEDNYEELDIDRLRSPEEFEAVVRDVGMQLGRGHPLGIADPLDLQLRRALIQVVRDHRAEIGEAVHTLAGQTVKAFTRFRKEVQPKKPTPRNVP